MPSPSVNGMLSVRDQMVLDLAGATYRYPAVRVTHARERVGYSEVEFWQRVGWLLEQPEAASHPAVPRLRRLRDRRKAHRRDRDVNHQAS